MTETEETQKTEIPSDFEIRKATPDDIDVVWNIIEQDAKWLAEQDLNHWDKYYTREMVGKMLARKEVYLGFDGQKPVGTITFDTRPPKYYIEPSYGERFTNPDDPAMYLTAVAVLPEEHGKGYASKLMQHVESEARARDMKWIRLDCRAEVPRLVQFYEKRGFTKLGDEPVDEGEDGTYWLMEKALQ